MAGSPAARLSRIASANGVPVTRSDAVVDLCPDWCSRRDGAGDGESEEAGGRAEREAGEGGCRGREGARRQR